MLKTDNLSIIRAWKLCSKLFTKRTFDQPVPNWQQGVNKTPRKLKETKAYFKIDFFNENYSKDAFALGIQFTKFAFIFCIYDCTNIKIIRNFHFDNTITAISSISKSQSFSPQSPERKVKDPNVSTRTWDDFFWNVGRQQSQIRSRTLI